MPSPEKTDLRQKAVLWVPNGVNKYGEKTFADPIEISVRWNTQRRATLDGKGNTVMLDATAVVDRVIAIGSEMWLGELEDWYGTGSVSGDDELMYVKTYNETPDLRNREKMQTVGLMKAKETPDNG